MASLPPRSSDAALDRAVRLFAPFTRYHNPSFSGLEHIPSTGAALLVGNHTVLGVVDVPHLFAGIWAHKRRALRALGHHAHFRIPGWRRFLRRAGVVDGTRENCAALFEAGELVLVFPGGSREVTKRKGQRYQLLWGDRLGFATLAVRHRVPIVPFASVGVEDALDVWIDGDQVLSTPVGTALRWIGFPPDLVPPLVRGVGPLPIPRPERFRFAFAPPVDPSAFAHLPESEAAVAVRDAVRHAVEAAIRSLQSERLRSGGMA